MEVNWTMTMMGEQAGRISETELRQQVDRCKNRLNEMSNIFRNCVNRTDDLRAKALFEVSAEVVTALSKSFQDYENKTEPAWR